LSFDSDIHEPNRIRSGRSGTVGRTLEN